MNILFLHNNFPAQFQNLAQELASNPSHRVVAIGSETAQPVPNVDLLRYRTPGYDVSPTHPFARRFDAECRRATAVLYALSELRASGFAPDLIVGHCGWGETLPLRSVFPRARIGIYCEYYYRPEGQDVHFDAEGPQLGVDGVIALHCKNASTLLSLAEADFGLSPTEWQKQTYPAEYQAKIHVVHEGVDEVRLSPDEEARFLLPNGELLDRGKEIVTFVARNLEPMRGYHIFMRALPRILDARPEAQVVIVGGDGVSYGPSPPEGKSWKSIYLDEVAGRLDLSRVHFLPYLPYDEYVRLLQVSRTHVYLTFPFVLSWSLIEAMALGCVIVASDTAPVREAITHEINGLLTSFHDPDALADQVARVLSDPVAFVQLGRAARATALGRYARSACIAEAMERLGLERPEKGAAGGPEALRKVV
ncbi:glycosyltransferase [Rhodoblastus acidophilus]|uniref:Glycosyltransferase n=1 Tax=Candidatus Rhodoblastus alkanivorans TaxID=2954117 RepID=A0ABS9Z102_9HYPH|nr:glycosyltransferase [Candidatus Rhodoblastus alkanivorans]MCI4678573.1 glycosyltransferase [Candidatus Rhodoblastus alkanivorans]MCI4681339.1 glycosyltransferase [Candidatus Rhodoblastus alkanivorans]MDI4642386.1 glycosyltransferase [Rhodoblastus acidophilus]